MRSRALTIVELLVVIAVIGALLGLLLSALRSVSATSRSARCQVNLRQMATACHGYAALYDAYPPAIRYQSKNGVFQLIAWDWVTTFSGQTISPGALWTFTDHPDEVQQCPECQSKSSFAGDPHTGYNYNTTYIGGESFSMQVGWETFRRGVPPHACSRVSQCVVFGDGGQKDGANKFMRAPLKSEGPTISLDTIYSGGQAFRHLSSTNVAYLDGHVGSLIKPHPGALETPTLLNQVLGFPKNGFLSNDDRAYDPR